MESASPWMTPELQAFRDAVRRFVAHEVTPHQARWREQQHVDRALWRQAGALGVLLADLPEEWGGAGGNFAHQCVVFEELAAAGDTAFGLHVHAIVAHYLLNHGTAAQKAAYLPRLASGEMIAAIAMSEPGAGSDLKGIRTSASATAEGYRLNGSKTFISNGYLADLIVVVAKTDPAAGSKGISLMLLETADNPGFRVGRILDKVGQKGQDTCELFFDDALVAPGNVLGGVEGRGFAQLMTELPYERTIVGVCAVACIERALALTIEHARTRKAFGQALIDMQNTRFVLAECKTEATVARVFIDRCIEDLIAGRQDTVAGLDGQVLAHRFAVQDRRPLRAAVRRLRLHARVSDRADVRGRARAAHLRRRQRDHEGNHRAFLVVRFTVRHQGDHAWQDRSPD